MTHRDDNGGLETGEKSGRSQIGHPLMMGAVAAVTASALSLAPMSADAQHSPRHFDDSTPNYHQVVQGDTLWDLSGRYFGDHYQWPRMWSYNTQITNPHWIYPGDIVYLQEVDRTEGQEAEPAAHHEFEEREQRELSEEETVGLYLPLGGMMTSEEETPVGRIIGSPKSARMLAEHDEAWVNFGDNAYTSEEEENLHDDDIEDIDGPDSVEEGDRFAIIRLDGQLEDDDGEARGHKYYIVGALEITEVPEDDEVARTAMIDESWREVERGDLLVPYERQLQLIQPREADQDLVAEIVDSLDPGFAFAPQEYVFIDRGAEDGVRPGNRFFAYQQWEGFENPRDQSAPEIPWQQVGQVMIVNVREDFSMAVITRSDRELFIGDRLEMYQGH